MKRWLKLDADWPFGYTAQKIRERFGRDGQLVWINLLAAAKRNIPEGEFSYTSEHHFWNQIGLYGDEPDFTPEEFLRYLGQLKQTRRTRRGDVVNTVLTHWGRWQDDWRRDEERERKSRNRAVSVRDKPGTENGRPRPNVPLEKEREKESKPLPDKPARKRDELWDSLTLELGSSPSTASERGRWNVALKQLRDVGATPVELRTRCSVYRKRWPEISLTPTALAANWGSLNSTSEMEPQDRWKHHFAAKEQP